MTLVLHFNHFSGKLDGGYLRANGKRVGNIMTRAAVLAYMVENPDARCDPLRV